jgi:hypothetical protein
MEGPGDAVERTQRKGVMLKASQALNTPALDDGMPSATPTRLSRETPGSDAVVTSDDDELINRCRATCHGVTTYKRIGAYHRTG